MRQELSSETMAAIKKYVVDGDSDALDSYDIHLELYEYYSDQMPYGTAKARDGDPYEWIATRVLGDFADVA